MSLENKAPKFFIVLAVLFYAFLWTPVIILILFSFNSDKFGVRWEQFTLKWYIEFLNNVAAKDALKTSLIVASVTVVASTAFGTLTAYGLYKLKFPGRGILRSSILLPIVVPYVVTGGSLLVFFTRVFRVSLGYPSILIAHITFSTPLAVFVILGRMQRIDWSWEEAAMDLGANRLIAFIKVIGPILLPGIAASAMLIFPWSFDDFVITFFVAGIGTTTLPIYVYSQVRYGVSPVINTIGTIFIVATIIPLMLSSILQRK